MHFTKKTPSILIAVFALSSLLLPSVAQAQGNDTGNLGIPAPGSIQSGVGIVSGWKCTSNGLTARFDGGDALPIAYGTPRGDTLGRCSDPEQQNTAFALQWNYSNLEDGEHLLEILDGGEVWRSVNFSVQRVAGARFLRGIERCTGLTSFPGQADMQHVEWQQASQSFVLVSSCDTEGSSASAGSPLSSVQQAVPGALENPGAGAKMSGIGIVSGWRCAGNNITAQFNDREPIEVAYGTPRGDTRGECADLNRVNNAYVLQWNYALLGDGEHTLRLFDDGVEFASTTFDVQTLGAPFVRDLEGEYQIQGFPEAGQNVVIEWQQGKQGFGVIVSDLVGPTPEPTPTPKPTVPFDRNVLLGQFADEVILPSVRDFANRAADLASATRVWAGFLTESNREAAQSAWTSAMASFQFLEPMQFGPAGSASMFAGGLGIRDEIYSWPTVNYCAVDQVTVDGDFNAGDFFQSKLVNVYGLDALELLLFRPGAANACSPRIDINRDGTWNDLVASGRLAQNQADYAVVVAEGVLQQAEFLRNSWEPSDGNFTATLRDAGRGSSVYGSAKEAFDEIFAAFFVVDTYFKDAKLALPAGITPECPVDVCPEYVELPFSRSSKLALVANLDGLMAIFAGEGTSNGGFVWYLEDGGAAPLGARMSDQLSKARSAVGSIPGSLTDALTSDPASVITAFTELQLFTTDMKSEFVSVLNLAVPQQGAGDND